jgi:Universal stress protein family
VNGSGSEQNGRIVVGVDGSEGSRNALRWAARQATYTGAALEAVIGWEYPAFYGWAAAIPDDLDYGSSPNMPWTRPWTKCSAEIVRRGCGPAWCARTRRWP